MIPIEGKQGGKGGERGAGGRGEGFGKCVRGRRGGEDGGPGDDEGPGGDEEDPGEDEEPDNEEEERCTEPRQPQPKYNNSCEYIHSECKGKTKLVNYLSLVVCDLRVAQVANYTHVACYCCKTKLLHHRACHT